MAVVAWPGGVCGVNVRAGLSSSLPSLSPVPFLRSLGIGKPWENVRLITLRLPCLRRFCFFNAGVGFLTILRVSGESGAADGVADGVRHMGVGEPAALGVRARDGRGAAGSVQPGRLQGHQPVRHRGLLRHRKAQRPQRAPPRKIHPGVSR
jgi:hypothetical protein